jgi:hypothetical protein
MTKIPRLPDVEVERIYKELRKAHTKHLLNKGVSLPNLYSGIGFTQSAIALVGLYLMIGKPVTKSDLTTFVRIYVHGAEDLQEGRHLGSQRGWYVISSARKDPGTEGWPRDSYCLVSITKSFPDWVNPKTRDRDWETRNRKTHALLNPNLILRSPESVQFEVWKILHRKFK